MKLELTEAEALVLSDWLYKNSNKKELFDDLAEQYVLWHIDFQLEKELVFTEDNADAIGLNTVCLNIKHREKKEDVECIEVDDFKEILKYIVKR